MEALGTTVGVRAVDIVWEMAMKVAVDSLPPAVGRMSVRLRMA